MQLSNSQDAISKVGEVATAHLSREEALTLTSGTAMWLWSDSGEGDAVSVRCVVASALSAVGDSASMLSPTTTPPLAKGYRRYRYVKKVKG